MDATARTDTDTDIAIAIAIATATGTGTDTGTGTGRSYLAAFTWTPRDVRDVGLFIGDLAPALPQGRIPEGAALR